mgnify:CR=1 FL=1
MPITLIEELSKSRTEKHAVRRIALIITRNGEVRPAKGVEEEIKPVYVKGKAKKIIVNLKDDEFGVQIHLVKNIYGKVKGFIEVYRSDGALVFKAVYRKLKLRRSMGDIRYAWIIKLAADKIKLPVKRYNLGVPL